jgi:hypothetical protein
MKKILIFGDDDNMAVWLKEVNVIEEGIQIVFKRKSYDKYAIENKLENKIEYQVTVMPWDDVFKYMKDGYKKGEWKKDYFEYDFAFDRKDYQGSKKEK